MIFNYLISRLYFYFSASEQFKNDQKGVAVIEYGLIAVALSVFLVVILYGENNFILAVEAKFTDLSQMISRVILGTN